MTATTTTETPKPAALPVNADAIPAELRAQRSWVNWRFTWNAEKGYWDKPPFKPDGALASATESSTWSDFGTVLVAYERGAFDGIGWVPIDGYIGGDLDHIRDPATGRLTAWSGTLRHKFKGTGAPDPLEILNRLRTYSETSPSGTGIRFVCRGKLPEHGRKIGGKAGKCPDGFEIYDGKHYLTITGQKLPEVPSEIADYNGELTTIHEAIFGKQEKPTPPADGHSGVGATEAQKNTQQSNSSGEPADDQTIIDKAASAKNGAKFERLFIDGDTTTYSSASEADSALAAILAFWTRSPERIERIMRRSALVRPKWDREDYLARTISEALALVKEHYEWRRTDLPEIDAGCDDLPKVTRQGWDAVHLANAPPRLFRFGGRVVRTETGDEDELLLQDVTIDRMRWELSECASWVRWVKVGRGADADIVRKPASPPDKVVRNVLATPDIDLPILFRVVCAPVFGPDGSLQTTPGYHPGSRTFFAPSPGLSVAEVPARPSTADVQAARELIEQELLGEFPFVDAGERAHAVALLLQPFARDLIDGATPLYLIEKPSPGTGATLLADMLLWPMTGGPPLIMTEGRDEDEWRKRTTAALRSGASHIVVDNVKNRLESASLSAAITSSTWTDRLLGSSTIVKTPVRCVWMATGNNPVLSDEMSRRTVRIRLDAKQDRPWLREGFRHPDLRGWAMENRGQLVWAALVLIRAWLAAGRPKGAKRLGMFESWAAVMGGILDVAGMPGFLGNLNEFYQESDEEGTATRAFVAAWWDKYEGEAVTTQDLWNVYLRQDIDLPIGAGDEHSQKTRLGRFVRRLRDRCFVLQAEVARRKDDDDGPPQPLQQPPQELPERRVRICRDGTSRGAVLWKLVEMGKDGSNV